MNRRASKFLQFDKTHQFLVILLFIGGFCRISGIFWGLPPFDYKEYHPDEPKIILGAYNFPEDITTRRDLRYPTACHYLLGTLVWPLKKGLEASGQSAYYHVYLIGRLLTVVVGTFTILLVYLLAKTLFDAQHGLCASTMLTFSMLHVTNSSWATTDVASAFFLTAFLLALLKTLRRPSSFNAIFTGALLGLLIGTKYTGALAVIPCLLILMHRHTSACSKHITTWIRTICTDRMLWLLVITSIVVFFLSTPTILLHPEELLSALQSERARMAQLQLPFFNVTLWKNQFSTLVQAIGMPLALVACVGVVMSFFNASAIEISLGVMVLAFSLMFRNALLPRYIIFLMPILAVLSSRVMLLFAASKQRAIRILWLGGMVVVMGHAIFYSFCAIADRYPDTRTEATDFIFEQISPGASIGIAYTSKRYHHTYHGWRYPWVDFTTYGQVEFLDSPQYLIVSSYDSESIKKTLASGVLSDTYEIPEALKKQWYRESPPEPEIFAFFDDLYFQDNSLYQLIARFAPKPHLIPIEFPPPTIEIFKRQSIEP